MAVLYIAEFADGRDVGGIVGVAMAPPIAEQTVAIGVSTTQSSAFNNDTKVIRVHADAICSIAIANSGTATATTGKMRFAAGQTEYFGVQRGAKIAVVTNT